MPHPIMNRPQVSQLADIIARFGVVNTLEGLQRACALLADNSEGCAGVKDYIEASNALAGMQAQAVRMNIKV